MTWTFANILTVFRLVLLPFIIVLFYIDAAWAAWSILTLYTIGAVTDWFDGWVARRFNQVSAFGTFMDPIADKIFVAAVLFMLVESGRLTGIWVLPAIVILVREFLISGLREFLGPKDIKLPVTKFAKWKTASQMLALGFLIIGPYGTGFLALSPLIGNILLTAAAAMTALTGWRYLRAGFAHMR